MRFGPSVPTTFTCPDCCSASKRDCQVKFQLARLVSHSHVLLLQEAVQTYRPVQVSVLALYLTCCMSVAGSLLNVFEGTLRAQGTTVIIFAFRVFTAPDVPVSR